MKYKFLFIIVAVLLAVSGCRKENPEAVFYNRLHSSNRIVFAGMTISKMATIDDIKFEDAHGMKQKTDALLASLKVGKRKAAYSYDTYMRAFIDLSALTPDDIKVDEAAKRVTITLPPVQTEFAGRDFGLREDHYRVTGLRSNINAKERAEIKERMNEHLKQEVENNETFKAVLTEKAQSKARSYFESLIAESGYTPIIRFR